MTVAPEQKVDPPEGKADVPEKKFDPLEDKVTSPSYVLRLYVTGTTARSAAAIANLRRICEERMPGEYDLEVIDLYQNPLAAQQNQIVAAPTLLKVLPQPLRRIIGSLADEERVLAGLDLSPKSSS